MLPGLGAGEAKASAPAAQNFLSKGTAAEPGGISAAGQHRSAEGGPPPGAGAADHLFDRDPHLGAAVYHRRDAAASKGDGSQQGENSGDPAAAPAVCRAQRLGKGRSHTEWTGLCYPERTSVGPLQRLVADEGAVCRGAGGPEQGFSAQSAPPVRPHLLPDGEGSEPSGRPAGSQQHPDHPHLSHGEWGGAPADAGEDAAAAIKKPQNDPFVVKMFGL